MADIIVDVSLPSPVITDVTSPTQALATNISVPGPQGPAGPRGLAPLINGITGNSILFSGQNGIIILADQAINTIYISGNSGYFEGKINSLTNNLESTGSNLYSLLINFSGNLDANYATDTQLFNTGSSLDGKINSLSGWSASAINLQQTGENLYSLLINFSGNLDASYASDAQLFATGSTLDTKINSLSGYVDIQDNSILLNLNSTGSILDNRINSLSGYSASIVNLASTGSNLYTLITNFSGNLDADFASQAELNSLSGYINSSSSNIIFTTGNQIKSGRLIIGNTIVDATYPYTLSLQSNNQDTFLEILNSGGSNKGAFFGMNEDRFEQYNWQGGDIIFFTAENASNGLARLTIKNDGKVGIGTNSPSEKLEVAGNIIANNLVYNTGNQTVSGIKTFNIAPFVSGNQLITGDLSLYATKINVETTGSTLDSKINSLSGWSASAVNLTSTGATLITNLFNTGSNLNNKIDNLSGYVNTQDNAISTNLRTTGSTLDDKINSLSGVTVLTYDNQIIFGTKYFNEDVYIHNLYVTGDEFIANTINNFIESPYLLLNLTGGAIDGGIFFVTGSGFTGINDLGPIIGFDHSDKFKFGISSRGADLSTLNDIASVQEIQTYSGFVDNKYATIINLASTGSTLQTQIDNLGNTYATVTNLANTGSALDSKINSLSGTLTSDYATVANLASTGSALDNKVNILSGFSVLTFGNQLINGTKTFNSGVVINVQPTGTNPALNITGTWNNASQIYTGIALDIVDTNSNSNSSLMTLRVGGSNRFTFDKNGTLTSSANMRATYFESTNAGVLIDFSNGISLGSAKRLGWSSNPNAAFALDLELWRDAADTLALRRSTNPQQFRIYNATGTNSGEFGLFGWQNNQLIVGSQAASSGISRDVLLTGNNVLISGNNLRLGSDGIIRGFRFIASDTNFPFQAGSVYEVGTDGSRPIVKVRNDGAYSFSSSYGLGTPDILLERDAAGTLALRNGTNPQTFNIYNTYTNASNHERGFLRWSSNVFEIGAEATGSGTRRTTRIIAQDKTGGFGPTVELAFYPNNTLSQRLSFTNNGGAAVQWGINGTYIGNFSTDGFMVGSSQIGWNGGIPQNAADLILTRDAADILAQRRTTNPQQFRIYNSTGTNSGEFALFGWQNNNLIIGSQATNSGILRNVVITGSEVTLSGSSIFIGTDSSSPRGTRLQTQGGGFTIQPNIGGSRQWTMGNTAFYNNGGFSIGQTSQTTTLNSNTLVITTSNNLTEQYNGANPQSLRIFNRTGTNTGEFGLFGWVNTGLVIGPQQTNDGILRDLTLTGANININASGLFNIFDNTNIVGNLNVTGNILLSGNQVLTGSSTLYATSANLASTGSTLDNKINSLSGNLTANYATITNLASTGSTLDTKINNLSGVSVLTFGNQTIGGNKTFTGVTTFSGQEVNFINSPVFISGTNLRVDGDILLSGTPVATINRGILTKGGFETFEVYPEVNGSIFSGYFLGKTTQSSFSMGVVKYELDETTLSNFAVIWVRSDGIGAVVAGTGAVRIENTNGLTYTRTRGLVDDYDNILDFPNKSGIVALVSDISDISGYVNSTDSNIVFTTGNQTISGVKTFIGNHNISGNTLISGSINISGNYDVFSQIENAKRLAIAYAIAL